MEQSLTDRGDEEELTDTKVRGVHSTDSRLHPAQICLQCMIWAKACRVCGKYQTLELIDAHSWNKV